MSIEDILKNIGAIGVKNATKKRNPDVIIRA